MNFNKWNECGGFYYGRLKTAHYVLHLQHGYTSSDSFLVGMTVFQMPNFLQTLTIYQSDTQNYIKLGVKFT